MLSNSRYVALNLRLQQLKLAEKLVYQIKNKWNLIESKIVAYERKFVQMQQQKEQLLNQLTKGSTKGIANKDEDWANAAVLEEALCLILWYIEMLKVYKKEFKVLALKSQALQYGLLITTITRDLADF